MPTNVYSAYLAEVEKNLSGGRATEHTHRPALKKLIEAFGNGLTATNEPTREKCGAPDFIVTRGDIPLGYIETKDVGISLDKEEKSEQMKRYLGGLTNLILTDYLEFRWYENGKRQMVARLGEYQTNRKFRKDKEGPSQLQQLVDAFLESRIPTIGDAKELAGRMAGMARIISDIIVQALKDEDKGGSLSTQLDGFRKVLLRDLTADEFAAMYGQTICYGLFAARCNHDKPIPFTRQAAMFELPETNPFLRDMFEYLAGSRLDMRLVWAVEHLAGLLDRADMHAILTGFGRMTGREDPVVHFYETFLRAYSPTLRKARGVYYTPVPVVSYIVRSVDHILKTDFGISDGLADTTKIQIRQRDEQESSRTGVEEGKVRTTECHKVLILDPALGTGTFLYGVIAHIFQHLSETGRRGMWSPYVSQELLPRVFGFEFLMAPYAVAHMKLGLQLKEYGYDFRSGERLRIYLTNTLDEPRLFTDLELFANRIAEEANSAGKVKTESPVMVILGNPPYAGHSANNSDWIRDLLRGTENGISGRTANYFEVDGGPLGEKNPKWVNNDYVKFIRFGQWRIEKTGYGILAFITDNSYLDSPTFRGMRQSLLESFDDIYILNLHGNANRKEVSPDGSKDQNVFDIMQGVAISIFVKRNIHAREKNIANVRYADIWGLRETREKNSDGEPVLIGGKYAYLSEHSVHTTEWAEIAPQSPYYLFVPQDMQLNDEYQRGWKITDIMPVNSVGIVTARDSLSVQASPADVWKTVRNFVGLPPEEAREKYDLGPDARDWKVSFAQRDLRESGPNKANIIPVLYRPFDVRYTYYTGRSRGFICMPRPEVMKHMLAGENIGLLTSRLTKGETFKHVQVTRNISEVICMSPKTSNNGFMFPLYLYPQKGGLFENEITADASVGRRANISSEFIAAIEEITNLKYNPAPPGKGAASKIKHGKNHFTAEDIFHYIYAILHSPTYRSRYSGFLKGDFPRIPIISKAGFFLDLACLGKELVSRHLMEQSGQSLPDYPIGGDNRVDQVKYTLPGMVWINDEQYFEGVPEEIWEFRIGGYRVCEKWLKDRKGRVLSVDELNHYREIVSILMETVRLMAKIDRVIDDSGGWPIS